MAANICLEPALVQAERIRRGEVSAVELLDAHLERYQRFNSALNAVVFTKLERARARAVEADAARARGESWGPFHGVPMTIKDSFDWSGAPSTWGVLEHRNNVATEDSAAVRAMEGAGAILWGKTNIPFMLADWQSFNAIYGTTNNPWDLGRTPGGSSGGSAVALATGMSSLDVGSDIGASIRNPAHYCGVFGHKPTYGIVPATGHKLPGDHTRLDIAVCGPLARSARDLRVALKVLAQPEGEDACAWRLQLPEPEQRELSDFKVGVLLQSPACAQDDELTERLQATVDALVRAGLRAVDNAVPDFDLSHCQHVYLMLLRAATGSRVSDEVFAENLRSAAARPVDDRSYPAYVDRGVTVSHRDWWQLDNARGMMRAKWEEYFEDYDLLLCPAAASAAFPHDQDGDRAYRTIHVNDGWEPTTDQMFWAGYSGVSYLPSTVAPVGLTKSGLPCGLQIVAPYLHDLRAIEFARLVEQTVGGFQPAPDFG
ncbi:MAG: amidase [Gammaproteobacteria bacterium]|nr:amidase [Gammaproteobacteria bacterium]